MRRWRNPLRALTALPLLLATGAIAQRQPEYRDPTIADLPRPGYEPRTIVLGSAVFEPTLDTSVTYSDNILATRDRKIDDVITTVSPRIVVTRKSQSLNLRADAHASAIRYASNDRENVTTFGLGVEANLPFSTGRSLTATAAFDRTFEGRSDPEADIDRALRPALINIASVGLRYEAQGARFGVIASAAATKVDYLPAIDADRDLMSYQASLRGSINAGKRIAFFVQPFVNRRSFRLKVTRTGVFGDTTTSGALAGVSFDLADRLQGELGVGIFNANPDAAQTPSFTGLAASGRILWRPRVRTAVVLDLARGDVATIRAGALGRIDTRVSLSVDQEVRHNLLMRAVVSLHSLHYRGGLDNDQRYLVGKLEAQYLFNRHLAAFVSTDYVDRSAQLDTESFARWQGTVGIRLVY